MLVSVNQSSPHIVIMFYVFAGLDKIEYLQSHSNQDIYQKAYTMIDKYFSHDEAGDEDNRLAPQQNQQGQFAFGVPGPAGDGQPPIGGWEF